MRAQASVEMLLLTAGVVLGAVVAGYYVVSSTMSIYNELNSVATSTTTTTGGGGGNFSVVDAFPTVSATVNPTSGDTTTTFNLGCSASDDSNITTIDLLVCTAGSCTFQKSCTINAASGSCFASGTFSDGSYELNCIATDDSGKLAYDTATFTVITSTSPNNPPAASFTYSPTSPTTADTIEFNSTSTDPDGDSLSCSWDFNDGFTATGCNTTHRYSTAGTYAVTLSVSDGIDTTTVTQTIVVASAPSTDTTAPTVTLTGVPTTWQNTSATVSVSCSDSESGCDSASYRIYTSTSAIISCPTDYTQYTQTSPATISSHVWACGAAKDISGNVGFSSVYEITVDTTAPTTSTTDLLGNSPYTVKFTCTDSESGCAATYYHYAPGSVSCSSDTTLYAEGSSVTLTCSSTVCTYTVCAYSVDNAGNVESPKSFTVGVIGKSSPIIPPPSPIVPIVPIVPSPITFA